MLYSRDLFSMIRRNQSIAMSSNDRRILAFKFTDVHAFSGFLLAPALRIMSTREVHLFYLYSLYQGLLCLGFARVVGDGDVRI